jgi:CRP-like cAMP-binding protein
MSVQQSGTRHEPLFMSALEEGERRALTAAGMLRTFPAGTALFHERQVADRVLVVLAGFVKLSCFSEDGREVVLGIRGPGDLLGELAAIDGNPRSATGVALDPVDALAVSTAAFNQFLDNNPRVFRVLFQMLAHRLRDADRQRLEFAAKESMGRVASRIVEMAERFGVSGDDGIQIDFPLTQEELAGWTACSRDSVVKALQSMRDLGWIETGRRRITVIDVDAIRRRAA